MSEDWKRELKNVKKFQGLNDGWSAFGLKSKKAEPPKQLPFPCQHCAQSYSMILAKAKMTMNQMRF